MRGSGEKKKNHKTLSQKTRGNGVRNIIDNVWFLGNNKKDNYFWKLKKQIVK